MSIPQDELNEGIGSLVGVNDRIKDLISELEETIRNIEVWFFAVLVYGVYDVVTLMLQLI